MSTSLRSRLVRTAASAAIILTVAAGVVGFGMIASHDPPPRSEGPGIQPLPVEALTVKWEDSYTVTRSFVGRVEARQESDVGFEIAGAIDAVLVEEGQRVERGEPIARLNTDRLTARRAELVASRDRSAADAELAQLRFERIADARASNAASIQAYDDAEKGLQSARAALAAAAAAVETIDTEISKAEIRSPFDAVVAERLADAGRVIGAGMPVARLLERTTPEVRFSLAGDAADELWVDQDLSITVRGRRHSGRVAAVLPTRDAAARGVDVIVRLDVPLAEARGGIRQGDLARLELALARDARGFWVPTQALSEGVRGLWSLYLLEPSADEPRNARIVRADVAILHQETDRAYVTGALGEADRFVAAGLHRVAPGTIVRFAQTTENAKTGDSE